MSFNDDVTRHLSLYKEHSLGVFENGIYRHRGKEITRSYILPNGYWERNFPADFDFFIKDNTLFLGTLPPISLHRYWYHLNSSQVLCISYFYEFIKDRALLCSLCEYLGVGAPVSACFELVENKNEGTSVDFAIMLENGGRVYFEIKYTEQIFGSASSALGKRDFEQTREYYLGRKSRFYSSVDISDNDYLKHYQVVRNISLCPKSSGNKTVFLIPKANTGVCDSLYSGLGAIRNLDGFNYEVVFWEELLEKLPSKWVFEKYFDLK